MKLVVLAVVVVLGGPGCGILEHQSDAAAPVTQATPVAAAPGDQTIEMTESELTTVLNEHMAGRTLGETPVGSATMQQVTAQLRNGHIGATGNAVVGSASVPVEMTASMHVDNGRALVVIDDLRAAGVPLPAGAREPVRDAVQAQLDQQVQARHLRVTSISVADGKLRLVGSPD